MASTRQQIIDGMSRQAAEDSWAGVYFATQDIEPVRADMLVALFRDPDDAWDWLQALEHPQNYYLYEAPFDRHKPYVPATGKSLAAEVEG